MSEPIMAAFGCNYEGDVPVQRVLDLTAQIFDLAAEHGLTIKPRQFKGRAQRQPRTRQHIAHPIP